MLPRDLGVAVCYHFKQSTGIVHVNDRDVISELAGACGKGSGRSVLCHDLAFDYLKFGTLDAVKKVVHLLAFAEFVLPIGHK